MKIHLFTIWGCRKAILSCTKLLGHWGRCIALNSYIRKGNIYKIINLNFHHRKPEKEEQSKPTAGRSKEIKEQKSMKLKMRKQQKKCKQTKSWFFENISEIHKPPARLTKSKREDTDYWYQNWKEYYNNLSH